MIKNFKWLLLISLAFAACNNDDDDTVAAVPATPGSADFSKYVALGNSLTAGYTDGALFIEGQKNSWTKILSDQMKYAGGGDFRIPYMSDNLGGLLYGGTLIAGNRYYLKQRDDSGNPISPTPTMLSGTPTTDITTVLTGPFNNMGVPGAKSFHLITPGYGNAAGVPLGQANPYFARFASSSSTTILDDAVAQHATFFTLWIGNNDILSYATTGGIGVNQMLSGNINPATYGANDITNPTVFGGAYTTILDAMTAGGAKGVVANIPYVTSIPFFTTVPYNPIPMDAPTAAFVTSGYAGYNSGLAAAFAGGLITADERDRRTITFHEGQNPVVIADSYLTNLAAQFLPSYRMATNEDLIVLTAAGKIGKPVGSDPTMVWGVSVPLIDGDLLSKNEVAEVVAATDAYNQIIRSLADSKGLAFVDANALLSRIANGGVTSGSFTFTSSLVFGNAFSLDGVHPTARGYAVIANEFVKAINHKFTATLPLVNTDNFNNLFAEHL